MVPGSNPGDPTLLYIMNKLKTFVLIPAFNAARTIQPLLNQLTAIKDKSLILVVDDGSDDDTFKQAKNFGVTTIKHDNNKGKGAAIVTGFQYLLGKKFDTVITLDADLQHPVQYIPEFETYFDKHLDKLDILIGNRMGNLQTMPILRRCSNTISSFIISKLVGEKLKDTQCGFRMIKRWVIENIQLQTVHFDTESEILLKAITHGARCDFIDIPTLYNGNSSNIKNFLDSYRFAKLIINYWRGNLEEKPT